MYGGHSKTFTLVYLCQNFSESLSPAMSAAT